MVKLLAERAFAKINLFLRVTGRREDGYHQLDSIFVPISISDRIAIEMRPTKTSSVTLRCNIAALADVQSNLASRAAGDFMREFAISAQVSIDLHKTIPAGAGLGGGSSDAGTVLGMLAAMTHQPREAIMRLHDIALGLGADVPFFLDPRPSRIGGIGERVEAIEKFPQLHLVVAVPPIEVPTAAIFKKLMREGWSGPAPSDHIDEIRRGDIASKHLVNDLEAPAIALYPQIAQLKALLQECGAGAALMTGSGGAVFGIFPDSAASERAADELRRRAPQARVFAAQSVAF